MYNATWKKKIFHRINKTLAHWNIYKKEGRAERDPCHPSDDPLKIYTFTAKRIPTTAREICVKSRHQRWVLLIRRKVGRLLTNRRADSGDIAKRFQRKSFWVLNSLLIFHFHKFSYQHHRPCGSNQTNEMREKPTESEDIVAVSRKRRAGTQWSRTMNSSIALLRRIEHDLTGKKAQLFRFGKRRVVQQNVPITVQSGYYPISWRNELIYNNRIYEIVWIMVNQVWLLKNCVTTDTIQVARLLI